MITYQVYKTAKDAAKAAAMVFASTIYQKPNAVLGLATGSTPIELYKRLIKLHEKELIDFSKVVAFNLDEYVGLDSTHDQSYRYFMNDQLFDHINIDKANTHVPSGLGDMAQNTREYDALIKAVGGIDLQLLGIGHNGHIGFNEPNASGLPHGTNIVDLTPSTIEANSRLFDSIDEVPKQAISVGVGGIMEAKRIVLIATGSGKAEIIAKSINGPITTGNPASMLQMHTNVQFFLDEDAAAQL